MECLHRNFLIGVAGFLLTLHGSNVTKGAFSRHGEWTQRAVGMCRCTQSVLGVVPLAVGKSYHLGNFGIHGETILCADSHQLGAVCFVAELGTSWEVPRGKSQQKGL